jgi:hypothetical protein
MDSLAWPGVFRPLRHHVPDHSQPMALADNWVYFAHCRCPCWPATESARDLPWCVECWAAVRRYAMV